MRDEPTASNEPCRQTRARALAACGARGPRAGRTGAGVASARGGRARPTGRGRDRGGVLGKKWKHRVREHASFDTHEYCDGYRLRTPSVSAASPRAMSGSHAPGWGGGHGRAQEWNGGRCARRVRQAMHSSVMRRVNLEAASLSGVNYPNARNSSPEPTRAAAVPAAPRTSAREASSAHRAVIVHTHPRSLEGGASTGVSGGGGGASTGGEGEVRLCSDCLSPQFARCQHVRGAVGPPKRAIAIRPTVSR